MRCLVRGWFWLAVCVLAFVAVPVVAVGEPNTKHPFAIEPGSFHVTASSYQAGAHANLTTTFTFDHAPVPEEQIYNDLKTTIVNLPPGFIGSDTAVPTCTDVELLSEARCPPATQIGTITLDLAPTDAIIGDPITQVPRRFTTAVYNMQSNTGVVATLGFSVGHDLSQILPVSIRPGDTGITVTSPSIQNADEPKAISFTVWGVPASPEHNAQRGEESFVELTPSGYVTQYNHMGGEVLDTPVRPFLSNPTSCTGAPLVATMSADSWEEPERFSEASSEIPPITGCERSPFYPTFEAQPTSVSAESPSGLNASVVVPQTYEDPETLATANLRDSRVTLPPGMTINPSAGSGLAGCSPEDLARETYASLPGEGCPPESKLGSMEIETPVLNEKLLGAIYLATPYDNPFGEPAHPGGSLLALYVVAKDFERGLIIKVAGKIELNPVTGQLVTTFDDTPQAPFSRFTLKFRPGATAPLSSPPACGFYSGQAEFTPWSAPLEPRLTSSTPFQITQGVREGPCPAGGVPPFHPQIVSGTQNNAAGSYTPFYLRIVREDGEQEITRFTTVLPPGLTGNLTGIPFCPEADIEAARHVSGTEEEANPSCPAASEVGHTLVEAGVGSVLAQTPGKIYLAGPYHGAPLSIVSITSAKVGPFDLGTVVIRFALDINHATAQVEVSANGSDPIPHIIDGIIVHVRDIHVYMSREKFILNPTSCEPLTIAETIDGAGADPANPADQQPVTATAPFEAADCANLKFEPKFEVSTAAKTSKADGASLAVRLSLPNVGGHASQASGQSDIKQVKVELPKVLPSRLTTLQKACTAAQFKANPAGCPPGSIVGHAKAITPLIPEPLEGPAYFVSNGSEAFPNLIVVLQGYGFTIDLVGDTFISKAGITSSTFKTVPDQPVGSFELTLPEGPYSALAATGNLCSQTRTVTVKKKITIRTHGRKKTVTRKVSSTVAAALQMPTEFIAQNGAVIHQNTPIEVTGCANKPNTKVKHAKRASKSSRHAQARNRRG
jgi:hypothetical protein